MKKFCLVVSLLTCITAFGQNFEGTITWSIRYEPTDASKKAEMIKGQQSANDPARREKLQKLQEQMNTPQMKSMMDGNPQMKAQMEKSMKAMQDSSAGTDQPVHFVLKIKGNNSLTKMDAGAMSFEVLYLKDKGLSYVLNRAAKTYTSVNTDSAVRSTADTIKHTVTKTGETMKILDYTCTKYIVETIGLVDTIRQFFWTTPEIKGLDMKNFSRQKTGEGQSTYYKDIAGVALRTETHTKQVTVVMEVTDIKKEALPDTDFIIPADFKDSKDM